MILSVKSFRHGHGLLLLSQRGSRKAKFPFSHLWSRCANTLNRSVTQDHKGRLRAYFTFGQLLIIGYINLLCQP